LNFANSRTPSQQTPGIMRLLILLALVGLAFAAPQVPQVYAFDYFNHEENRAQFLRRNGETYSWGYEFPDRVHLENSNGPGYVEGSYGYVDANGVPVLVQYESHPTKGFTADIQEAPSVQAFPASRSEVRFQDVRESEVSPYSALLNELPVEGDLAAPAPLLKLLPTQPVLSPLLKSAVDQGKITQIEILEDGSSTFVVKPAFVEEAESVSNLAVQLGASLPAAVHDVRSPNPSFYEVSPALDFQDDMYILRVPAADPSLGPAVIEI